MRSRRGGRNGTRGSLRMYNGANRNLITVLPTCPRRQRSHLPLGFPLTWLLQRHSVLSGRPVRWKRLNPATVLPYARMPICLTVIEGPHQGHVYNFGGHDTFLVGRSKHAHFRLPNKDKYFSRIHFLMEVNPP